MATRAGFGYQCSGRFDDSIQISLPRQYSLIAQLVELRTFNAEVVAVRRFDSSPTGGTQVRIPKRSKGVACKAISREFESFFSLKNGKVAQSVERWFEEPCQRKFNSFSFHNEYFYA